LRRSFASTGRSHWRCAWHAGRRGGRCIGRGKQSRGAATKHHSSMLRAQAMRCEVRQGKAIQDEGRRGEAIQGDRTGEQGERDGVIDAACVEADDGLRRRSFPQLRARASPQDRLATPIAVQPPLLALRSRLLFSSSPLHTAAVHVPRLAIHTYINAATVGRLGYCHLPLCAWSQPSSIYSTLALVSSASACLSNHETQRQRKPPQS
jgi:hypothetical protein